MILVEQASEDGRQRGSAKQRSNPDTLPPWPDEIVEFLSNSNCSSIG